LRNQRRKEGEAKEQRPEKEEGFDCRHWCRQCWNCAIRSRQCNMNLILPIDLRWGGGPFAQRMVEGLALFEAPPSFEANASTATSPSQVDGEDNSAASQIFQNPSPRIACPRRGVAV
jgi:hypothetical protein